MVIKGVSPHADFYPMLSDEAIAELAEDIKENGQRDPITVNRNGILLDGRNRLKACEMIGVDPLIEVYEGDDDGAFVRSRNERRHQATGSRAMSTALSLVEDDLRVEGRWKRGSLDSGKSPDSNENWLSHLRRAGTVLDYAADLADDVVSGKIAGQPFETCRGMDRTAWCEVCLVLTARLAGTRVRVTGGHWGWCVSGFLATGS